MIEPSIYFFLPIVGRNRQSLSLLQTDDIELELMGERKEIDFGRVGGGEKRRL